MKHPLLLLLLFVCCCCSPVFAADGTENRDTYRHLETFANVLTLIQQYYVDDVDSGKVINAAITGMLSSLDPHSAYMSPEDFRDLEEETSGSFSGIGIEISIRDGILTAVAPIEGSPADREGIQPGDQIIRINGELTKAMSLLDAVKKLRGEKGTMVTITILREGWQNTRDLTLIREAIPLYSVRTMELEPGFFSIRISNFQATTTRDIRNALNSMSRKPPVRGVILDLRNNPGGLLDQAVKVADLFLDQGIIVSTRGRDKEEQIVFRAHDDGGRNDFPMVVLVNSGSASGSEIVAGALQDHKRAIILGTPTFGKGSVQTILPLPDGSGIRLTTAKYYTPSGGSIQATGITPDMLVPLTTPTTAAETPSESARPDTIIRERDLPHHLKNDTHTEPPPKEIKGMEHPEDFNKIQEIQNIETLLKEDNQLRTALIILQSLDLATKKQPSKK
ncbi:S41 family peptidase [Desulfobulbus alkaliphilus]|uniref:S41 family peptidase n=1 Tax=Desulfobulbus alkaliphilus TaxID=869814 RepID=UPI0019667C61|nr:S41 family peptidase [Desulfobulbus alkaliphilus]MBM9536992.1 S41 family peptidase [Desulfobulbus alkaliphilus]